MSEKWNEQIVVVSREVLFDNERLAFQGFITNDGEYAEKGAEIFERFDSYEIKRRGNTKDLAPAENNMEINPSFKQPIPYAVVRQGDKIFAYKRLAGGGEERLHDSISIGVGGHMNKTEEDFDIFFYLMQDNLMRELEEELEIDTEVMEATVYALINDDSDEVGQVHFGILVLVDVDENAKISVRETDQLEGDWMTLEELLKPENFKVLENWSQIAVNALK